MDGQRPGIINARPPSAGLSDALLWNASGLIPPSQTKSKPSQTKPDQENGLGFSWIPSSDSRLFNGLRAIQIKKIQLPRWSVVCARAAARILRGPLPEAMGLEGPRQVRSAGAAAESAFRFDYHLHSLSQTPIFAEHLSSLTDRLLLMMVNCHPSPAST